ncbi:MAG TPA: D-alanine--D-alanine ligase [Pirellulales bacterium]|jgi:D-alanine-D-alanine ligase|nr:D-alanine--D-alanine ligase [Pirellulales bacterium]
MDGAAGAFGFRVALLYGGDSAEREISLHSGRQVALALSLAGHAPVMIDPAEISLSAIDWPSFDVCCLALHGGPGENGQIQQHLETLGVPYTGSGPAASRLAMHKSAAKLRFKSHGVPTLPSIAFTASEYRDAENTHPASAVRQQLQSLGFPLVIKPESQGSSLGISIAAHPAELSPGVRAAAEYDDCIIAEPYVAGREFTISLLGRDPLPMIEIVAPQRLFTYSAKYCSPKTEYQLNTGLPAAVEAQLYRAAVMAAEALGTAGLVRVDVMLDAQHRPWVLEVNTIPGMTVRSLSPRAAQAAGMEMPALVDWMVREARQRFRRRPVSRRRNAEFELRGTQQALM